MGRTTSVTARAAKWKKYTNDAFGKLVKVMEPKDTNNTDTTIYNAFKKLTLVTMPRDGVRQTRTSEALGTKNANDTTRISLEPPAPKAGPSNCEKGTTMTIQRCLILGLAALSLRAADVTILAVGPFGQPIQGCQVDSFRAVAKENGERRQYGKRFQGLMGNPIPWGEYEVRIGCGEADIYKQLTVDHANQFEVVAVSGQRMIVDHVKMKLAVKLDTAAPAAETWWIRLAGLYNGKSYTDRFAPANGEAVITDPDPGSYLVTISSTKGYSCVKEVDFVESTNAWTFHRANCSFEFDRFAHLVQDGDKRSQKQGGWYDEMRADRDAMRRTIDEALKKQ